jgi:hypothetical protein
MFKPFGTLWESPCAQDAGHRAIGIIVSLAEFLSCFYLTLPYCLFSCPFLLEWEYLLAAIGSWKNLTFFFFIFRGAQEFSLDHRLWS